MALSPEVYGIYLSSHTSNRLWSLLLNEYARARARACVRVRARAREADNQLHLGIRWQMSGYTSQRRGTVRTLPN